MVDNPRPPTLGLMFHLSSNSPSGYKLYYIHEKMAQWIQMEKKILLAHTGMDKGLSHRAQAETEEGTDEILNETGTLYLNILHSSKRVLDLKKENATGKRREKG
jgi:hypothetical protein